MLNLVSGHFVSKWEKSVCFHLSPERFGTNMFEKSRIHVLNPMLSRIATRVVVICEDSMHAFPLLFALNYHISCIFLFLRHAVPNNIYTLQSTFSFEDENRNHLVSPPDGGKPGKSFSFRVRSCANSVDSLDAAE